MKCGICFNSNHNKKLILKEMMFGLRDEFTYFECSQCGCIQIENVPENLEKYYPNNYYSYNAPKVPLKRSITRSAHYNYYAFNKNKILGKLLSLKFPPSGFYPWLKYLNLYNRNLSILDIGCGNGLLLKKIYRLGFTNLTGIDPFLNKDITLNKNIRLLQKDIFDVHEPFDVIMMHHSLEHMNRQHEVIKQAANILKNDGRMLIRIPIVSQPLMERYGANVVSLDPPRHLFVHSLKSITRLLEENNLIIYKTVFDAEPFSILASEQYARGISITNDERSHFQNPEGNTFTKKDIQNAETEINALNKKEASDTVALYIKKKAAQ